MPSLQNSFLQFSIELQSGRWRLNPAHSDETALTGIGLGAGFARGPRQLDIDSDAWELEAGRPERVTSVHGPMDRLRLRARPQAGPAHDSGVEWTLEYALPCEQPFLMWRVHVHNRGDAPVKLQHLDLAVAAQRPSGWRGLFSHALRGRGPEMDQERAAVRLHAKPGRPAFFVNGYQSWGFTGALHAHQRQPRSIFGPLGDPKHLNLCAPAPRRRGRFVSDMFGVMADLAHGAGLVAGFLSQREQFGVVEVLLNADGFSSFRLTAQCDGVPLPPGGHRPSDWAYLEFVDLAQIDPLGAYAEAAARENGARVPPHAPVGWCSWYQYYDRLTEADVHRNLDAMRGMRAHLPLDIVQVDDGYQAGVGDWFDTNGKFPRGLRALAQEIQSAGHTPGLWLAPYLVRSDARLAHEHPDWLLRESSGRRANAGFNWNRWCFGLDPTHPAVREHTRRLIDTAVNEWGFPYLKLDFLYAAALPARRYDPSLTRAQAMRLALTDVRQAAGEDVFFLGCGCPLGPAIGLVDAMRIGDDVAPHWDPYLFSRLLSPLLRSEAAFVSTRNAIRNVINRAPIHRRWWLNDPDCLLVREHDTELTEDEIRALVTVIALSGGTVMASDDLARLGQRAQRYLAPLLPVLPEGARPRRWLEAAMPDTLTMLVRGPDSLGAWLVAGLFNWESRTRDRTVDLAELGLPSDEAYWISDFWEERRWLQPARSPLVLRAMPPHSVRLLAMRASAPGPALVASTFHFSQGGEISQWSPHTNGLRFALSLGRVAEGDLWLQLPAAPSQVEASTGKAFLRPGDQGLFVLHLTVPNEAHVALSW